jgi:hypothetical protein
MNFCVNSRHQKIDRIRERRHTETADDCGGEHRQAAGFTTAPGRKREAEEDWGR